MDSVSDTLDCMAGSAWAPAPLCLTCDELAGSHHVGVDAFDIIRQAAHKHALSDRVILDAGQDVRMLRLESLSLWTPRRLLCHRLQHLGTHMLLLSEMKLPAVT